MYVVSIILGIIGWYQNNFGIIGGKKEVPERIIGKFWSIIDLSLIVPIDGVFTDNNAGFTGNLLN